MSESPFRDVLDANDEYVERFDLVGLAPSAARGLAIVTCIDTRIDPLGMLGLAPGDAKILRNAGARVNRETLRSLVLAIHLLGVHRVAVVAHTHCAMTTATNDELRAEISKRAGHSADGWDFEPVSDQSATLRADLARVRHCPLVPDTVALGGFVYDVDTGELREELLA
jgi:carbonic anhydrase